MANTDEVSRDTARQVLDLPMVPNRNDADATTVRAYLIALLLELWREQDQFYGKKPFGNSGWDYDLYSPLVTAGLIRGQVDEYGLDDVRRAGRLAADRRRDQRAGPHRLIRCRHGARPPRRVVGAGGCRVAAAQGRAIFTNRKRSS